MIIRKVAETSTTITLGWDPVPGADGYRFYSAGVLRSKTMDPSRKTVKFSKGQAPYKIEAVVLNPIDSGTYPSSPPPTYKKVAPRVAYAVAGADARFCVENQPGVVKQPNGTYRDEVAEYDADGLCLGSERSGSPAVTAANDINGRPYCSLPTMGDPTLNTGSWKV